MHLFIVIDIGTDICFIDANTTECLLLVGGLHSERAGRGPGEGHREDLPSSRQHPSYIIICIIYP